MNPSCLEHRLTESEQRTFNETGLLMVENALSPEQVVALTNASDRLYTPKVTEGMIRPKRSSIRTLSRTIPCSRIWSIMRRSCRK